MLTQRRNGLVLLAGVLLALLVQQQQPGAAAMSIESSPPQEATKPFKVTHKNSGPSYDIDLRENEAGVSSSSSNNDDGDSSPLVEKKRIAASEPASEVPPSPTTMVGSRGETEGDAEKVEHPYVFHMRRVFLVPVSSSSGRNDGPEDSDASSSDEAGAPQPSPFMARPFWPFMTPPAQMVPNEEDRSGPAMAPTTIQRAHHRHQHLFGADQASRSPNGDETRDRADSGVMFDPMRMILELMHQAINERLSGEQLEADLNKEATNKEPTNKEGGAEAEREKEKEVAGVEKGPQSRNETKEEIVEIEGKKYLKKSIVNRHVGENIIFMTKRLIFVPLNETTTTTDQQQQGTITTTATPTTTTLATSESSTANTDAKPDNTVEPKMTTAQEATTPTSSTTTSTVASEQPKEPSIDQPATSSTETRRPEAEETTTTPKVSLLDRVSEAIDKAAERIVEKAKEEIGGSSSTTTQAPTTSE